MRKQLLGISLALIAEVAFGALGITNGPASSILTTSAYVSATVTGTNGTGSNIWIVMYYGQNSYGTNASSWGFSRSTEVAGVYTTNFHLTNLLTATRYYYRAKAIETTNTVWSPTTTNFTTKVTSPTGDIPIVVYTVMVDSNAVLKAPTNLFRTNVGLLEDLGFSTNPPTTSDVAAVQADLDDHKTNTGVHAIAAITGLQTALDGKAGTAAVAAIDGRLSDVEAWPTGTWSQGASDAATWTSSVAHEIDSTATTAWWKASSDGASATARVAAVEADIAVLETQKLNVVTFDGFTNTLGTMAFEDAGDYATTGTVGAIDDRLSIVETGKLDVITAASTYATTGTVGAIDDRVSIVETGKVDYIDAEYTDTVARAAMVDSTATAAWWKASADGVTATAGVAAAEARLDVAETGKVDYVNSTYTATVAKADSALQPGADGTSTNLGDYNNDAGFITDAGVESLNTVTGAVTLQDGTNTSVRVDGQNIYVDNTYAAPVDSVFGETGAIVAAWPHYSAFYSLLRFNGTNYAGTNVFTGGGVTRTADGFEFSAAGIGTITNITGTDSSVVVTGGAGPETDLSVTNYVMGLGFLTNEPLWQASSGEVMQVVTDFPAVSNAATTGSNTAYIASTNAEAARVIATNAQQVANDALPKTFTNDADVAKLRITGGAVTSGVWVCTNATTGQGTVRRLKTKVVTHTAQTTNITALVITGVGFKPIGATVNANAEIALHAPCFSVAFIDALGTVSGMSSYSTDSAASMYQHAYAARIFWRPSGGSDSQHRLTFVSWDDDGATFSRSVTGAPTTNALVYQFLFYE